MAKALIAFEDVLNIPGAVQMACDPDLAPYLQRSIVGVGLTHAEAYAFYCRILAETHMRNAGSGKGVSIFKSLEEVMLKMPKQGLV